MKLSTEERARLLDALLDSIDQDQEVERAWEELADRRDEDLVSNAVAPVDGDEVLARLRAQFPG